MKTFQSIFGDQLSKYVELKRGLGLKFEMQEAILLAFDRYVCVQGHQGCLTEELALSFTTDRPNRSSTRCARLYLVVRNFSEYLAMFDPDTPHLDPKALRWPKDKPPVHICTEEELIRLLHEARHISRKNPIRGITLYTLVGLAASTGLRRSEVVRLDKADVDLETGVLMIRKTKFRKDRVVPVHPTTLDVLRDYVAARDAAYPDDDCPAFFMNMRRRRFSPGTVGTVFWNLARRTGLRRQNGKGLSFHSLRHRFAVQRLVAWYEEGVDVQAMLPALATYLGHVHYSETAYYITATAELLGLAAGRYHRTLMPQQVQP